jgi:hypothetical protein
VKELTREQLAQLNTQIENVPSLCRDGKTAIKEIIETLIGQKLTPPEPIYKLKDGQVYHASNRKDCMDMLILDSRWHRAGQVLFSYINEVGAGDIGLSGIYFDEYNNVIRRLINNKYTLVGTLSGTKVKPAGEE